LNKADGGLAVVGTTGGVGALIAAASCCVLPLALAGAGVTASALSPIVPLPLALLALVSVLAGWFFYYRRRRACAGDPSCTRPARTTPALLAIATLLVLLSLAWPLFEQRLVAALR